MKIHFFLSIILLVAYQFTYAQWTNGSGNINNTNSGNIGIGTANPIAVLDVGKPLIYANLGIVFARLSEGNTQGDGTYLGVKGYDTQPNGNTDINNVKSFAIEHSFYGQTNSSINFLRGLSQIGGSISFSTGNNSEQMRILNNGNVGIGIKNPQEKLAVNGTIYSKEVKVGMTDWPDYVFSVGYVLPSLKEVKKYININRHLMDLPTESEVVKTGLELGATSKILTKKIEELTLYLIEKDEQIEKQGKVNEELRSRNKQQDQRINALEQSLLKLSAGINYKQSPE